MACGQNNSLNETVRRRLGFVLFVFSAWTILLMARLADFMIFSRDALVATAPELQVKQIVKQARRGSITTVSGECLAWSEPVFELCWKVPDSNKQLKNHQKMIAELGIDTSNCDVGGLVVLRQSSSFEALAEFMALMDKFSWLDVRTKFIRHVNGNKKLIGEIVDGHGVSGLEKEFDLELRGCDGLYEAVTDRHGKLMPERSTVITPLRNGKDITVSLKEDSGT